MSSDQPAPALGFVLLQWLGYAASASLVPLALVGVVAVVVVVLSLAANPAEALWTLPGAASASADDAAVPASAADEGGPSTPAKPGLAKKASRQALRKQKSTAARVSATVSDAAVRAAVLLKQSPIPDTIARWTASTVSGYSRADTAFGIHDKVAQLSQAAVKQGITAASIAATAAIKAGVAYQTAPSYNEVHGYETEYSDDDNVESGSDADLVGNQLEVFEASEKGSKRVLAKRGRRRKIPLHHTLTPRPSVASLSSSKPLPSSVPLQQYRSLPDGPCVRILKLDTSLPGNFPPPATVESSTSTDPYLTGLANLCDENEACHECGAMLSPRFTPFNDFPNRIDYQNLSAAAQPSKSMIGSLYNTGATVAGRVATASSTYFLGKETTDILLGVSEATPSNGPMTKEEAFILQATAEARVALAETPIRCFCVGGVFCATSLRTLMRARGSKLKKWFTGVEGKCTDLSEETVKDWMQDGVMMRDGTFFIDRDGTHFHHIINHLRGLALSPSLDSRTSLQELRQEALFYNIVPLLVEIDERLLCVEMIEEEEIRELSKALKRMESIPKTNKSEPLVNESTPTPRNLSQQRTPTISRSQSPHSPVTVSSGSGTTTQTVSPEPKPSSLDFSSVAMSTTPLDPSTATAEGLRHRKPAAGAFEAAPPNQTPTPKNKDDTKSIASTTLSAYAIPDATTVVSSMFSFATTLIGARTAKPLVLANPDGGNTSSSDDDAQYSRKQASPSRRVSLTTAGGPSTSPARRGGSRSRTPVDRPASSASTAFWVDFVEADEDTYVYAAPTARGRAGAIEMEEVEEEEKEEGEATWDTAMAYSHEETLHRLLTKRREWRMRVESQGSCVAGVTDRQREEIVGLYDAKEQGVAGATLVQKAVGILNRASWRSVVVYNAKRLEQGRELTAYVDGGGVGAVMGAVGVVVEQGLQRVGVLCGMPPPPRNDVLMNFAWAVGCGVAVAVEVGVVCFVVWFLA
ncbi:hypothetical protein HDU98_003179 [Podochytrium sp. JEL0797]|nr:hypothetical protein HDU98_003179 [Podochytrium sp. JEL0797]